MPEAITYRTSEKITVLVGGRVSGTIKPSKGGGFYYRPKGGGRGETFPTVAAVKRSLEGAV